MELPRPAKLRHQARPFDDPDWVFELKHDGFRVFAVIEQGKTAFVSRNGSRLNGFGLLADECTRAVRAASAILDGEIAVPHQTGRTHVATLMEHRQDARFYAFDLLWLNGQDLRALPLLTRKQHLKVLLRRRSPWLVYVDHVMEHGRTLFQLACREHLEGIVAKRADNPYPSANTKPLWIKIKNPAYSQKEGRGEWFDKAKHRLADPTGRRHHTTTGRTKTKRGGR
jgi:bifunctional non-homologous end joining protein LigD